MSSHYGEFADQDSEPQTEYSQRQNAWVSGNGVGNLINGVASYGISRITGASLAPWRVLFLIYGSVTVVYAIVLYLVLPASPATAPFLKPREREVALHRTLENKTGVEDQNTYKISQVFLALKDPQAWLMFTYMFAVSIPNGAITSVSIAKALYGVVVLNQCFSFLV